MDQKTRILKAEHIYKSFPGVKALEDVEIEIKAGEIHALMGENGAGKSTLIKVLTGVYPKDKQSGDIIFKGQKLQLKSPEEAQKAGISTVYQEVNLCPNLSVAENIYIGREPIKNGRIDWKKMNQAATELLHRLNIKIDVTEQLAMYSVAIQQMIAIARAVDISAGLLILDEPTSSLDMDEVQELFRVMRQLKAEGIAIIFISHFIEQVYEIADRITILRNGHYIGTYDIGTIDYMTLVSKMMGKEFVKLEKNSSQTGQNDQAASLFLSLDKYGKKGKIRDVDLKVRKGEILGLAGLLGSGRTEIARLIFGIDKNDQGTMVIKNQVFKAMYPKKAIEQKMGFCPEDRKVEGIIGGLSVRENIILALQARAGLKKFISPKDQRKIAEKYVDLLKIKVSSIDQQIDQLSGGNQQKCILGRWLATEPELLILDEPTRGIDIGSRTEIQKLILNLAKSGMTIIMISSELEEVVSICDRALVLRDRAIVGEIKKEDMTETKIMETIAKGGQGQCSRN